MVLRLTRSVAFVLCACLLVGCPGENREGASGPFAPEEITLKEIEADGVQLMELQDERLRYIDARGAEWVAPRGTLTDGASVPRLALWVTDGRFDREFLKAAVVHDAYCQIDNKTRCPEQYRTKPWRDVHRMFHEACLAGGTSPTTAKLMFFAVWLGGPRWDDPQSDLGVVPDEVLQTAFATGEQMIREDDPSIETIETWVSRRAPTMVAVSKLESKGVSALREDNMATADEAREESEEILTQALEAMPEDRLLLNLKGLHHKNWAAEYDKKSMTEKVEQQLDQAEEAYQKVIQKRPEDPGALNGMGSVLNLRKDFTAAEPYVRKALEVEPKFKPAQRELNLIQKSRADQPQE